MARRTSTAWVVMEKPATRASPEEGGDGLVTILIVVVVPAPLEPRNPKTSPAVTERVTASTAVNVPKRRVRVWISRTASLMKKPVYGVNGRNCGSAILLRHGTNLLAVIPPDSLSPARVHELRRRCHRVRRRRCHVRPWPSEFARERLGSALGLAVNALVQSGDPVFPAARQPDGHARRRLVIRRLVGDFRNAIRRYIEWTF